MLIEISHTTEGGTIATGDTREAKEQLKAAGFRWSRTIEAWYIPGSRYHQPRQYRIDQAVKAIQETGGTATVSIEAPTVYDPAEREAQRAESVERRQEALTAKAGKLEQESDRRYEQAHKLQGFIPLGQPILVGHHSEKRHRRDLDRIDSNMRKSFEASQAAGEATERAEASRKDQAQRLSGPATMRRIERLETERRKIDRYLIEAEGNAAWTARLQVRREQLTAEIAYWQGHLKDLKAEGFKCWGPDDFQPGDRIRKSYGWATVERVNPKTLTTRDDAMPQFTSKTPYDDIREKAA